MGKIQDYLVGQFSEPHGLVGALVGHVLAFENRERIGWTVSQLQLTADDAVLEVGFGPGVGIALAADRVSAGSVTGVDSSEVMLRQARKRNAAAVKAGRVKLHLGRAEQLPFDDAQFSKAFAVNVVHLGAAMGAILRELRRVVRPGGLVAVTVQPTTAESPAALAALRERLRSECMGAGFSRVELVERPMRPAPSFCAVCTR